MTNLELIRSKVIEAVPEIEKQEEEADFIWDKLSELADGNLWNRLSKKDLETSKRLLSRPIQLADVLVAIQKFNINDEITYATYNTSLLIGRRAKDGYYTHDYWNLSQPLEGQSEETLQFLAEILK